MAVVSQDYVFRDPMFNYDWNKSVQQFYCAIAEQCKISRHFNSWSEVYALNKEKVKLSSGEVLASSQIDLLIILYRAFVKRNQQVSDPKRKPCRVSKYGYYNDAAKNFQLDALVQIINSEFDVLIEEVNIINSDRSRQGRPAIISGKADAFSQLCQYFQLGSCDDVREKLAKSLESAPNFETLYAYLNVITLQQQYNHSTVHKLLDEYLVCILNNPPNAVLQQQSLGFVKLIRDKYLISTQMQSLLKLHLSYFWVDLKIKDVKVVKSVEACWAILSIFKMFEPALSESTYQKLVYGKLCRCRTDEAMYLILAAYCYDIEKPFQWEEQEMSQIALNTLVQVLEQLLDIKFVVRESEFFRLGCIFNTFKESLVDHQHHLMRVSMLKFSHVGHMDIDSCYYSHDYMQYIIGCLGGPTEWAHVLLNSDVDFIAQLKGCIIAIGLYPDLDLMSQSLLDQVSVHLVNLFCGNEKLDFHILACYFQHLREMCLYAEEAVLKLKQIGSDKELSIICKMVPEYEDIVVMNFGSQFQPGWINECQRISNEVGFPQNIIQIVDVYNANSDKFSYILQYIEKAIANAVVKIVLKQPITSTSRYWFFEGLPVSILEESFVIQVYIKIWPTAMLASESLRVCEYSELALGFFQHIQCHDILPEKQVSLIQMFFTQAKYAQANNLVCEIKRLIKEFYGCKMEALLGEQ
ncbi:hypothetical protein MP228_012759 [Amoeboaphelidium protococcarum]|nr:hypothetical protein MP228_012759 [Amoeboaphelidium protococcarum]